MAEELFHVAPQRLDFVFAETEIRESSAAQHIFAGDFHGNLQIGKFELIAFSFVIFAIFVSWWVF